MLYNIQRILLFDFCSSIIKFKNPYLAADMIIEYKRHPFVTLKENFFLFRIYQNEILVWEIIGMEKSNFCSSSL